MSEKYNVPKKNIIPKNNTDMLLLVEKKIDFFKDVIQKIIIHVQENKFLDILGYLLCNSSAIEDNNKELFRIFKIVG